MVPTTGKFPEPLAGVLGRRNVSRFRQHPSRPEEQKSFTPLHPCWKCQVSNPSLVRQFRFHLVGVGDVVDVESVVADADTTGVISAATLQRAVVDLARLEDQVASLAGGVEELSIGEFRITGLLSFGDTPIDLPSLLRHPPTSICWQEEMAELLSMQ
jgi:hypothetical protein